MNYVGFYWTLPVNWAGFTSLPSDPDAAAKASQTIRYQVERVRRWVKDDGGHLVREVVFMETRPDRATEAIEKDLQREREKAGTLNAKLVLVNFAVAHHWRPHGALANLISDETVCIVLDPEPIMLDDKKWDPVEHFRAWRELDTAHQLAKDDAKAKAAAAIEQLKSKGASYAAVADRLNELGLKTVNGRKWSEDNVRKFIAAR